MKTNNIDFIITDAEGYALHCDRPVDLQALTECAIEAVNQFDGLGYGAVLYCHDNGAEIACGVIDHRLTDTQRLAGYVNAARDF